MPYLKKLDRDRIITNLRHCQVSNVGELNFAINHLVMKLLSNYAQLGYGELNDVIGAMESSKLEFYRRIVVPYEQGKIRDNGDCFQDFIRDHNLPTLF